MGTETDTSVPRASYSRVRTGCLTCRRRRKKCDERRPRCVGCERNHLLCSWPYSTLNSSQDSQLEQVQNEAKSSSLVPAKRLSTTPAVFRGHEGLVDFFKHMTAPRLIARRQIENPFITYNLRIAASCETLQHALIAVASCHRAYLEPGFSVVARSHYAVTIRSMKHAITSWSSCSFTDRLPILAAAFALCWYEIIDANLEGSLYHHLGACSAMLRDVEQDSRNTEPQLLGFFAEQYSYLAIAANVCFGLSTVATKRRPRLPQPVQNLNLGSPIHGFLFGYAHELHDAIPQIRNLADRVALEGNSAHVQAEYDKIYSTITSWEPRTAEGDPAYEQVGHMYQAACLVYLRTATHAQSEQPTEILFSQVEPFVKIFLDNFKSLSYESPAWNMFMWPTYVVGSCIRDPAQREVLSQILGHSTMQMSAVDTTLHCLSLHWKELDKDLAAYGPYGLERTMRLHKLDPCVG
ncbi:Fungal specific transcription factor domain containing protein [Rhypophila decipiens]